MLKTIPLSFLLIAMGCANSPSNKSTSYPINEELNFIFSRNFTLQLDKSKIPPCIIDSLSVINQEKFEIGDSSNEDEISFSDVVLDNNHKYNKRLNFMLLGDSICLIVYTEGGVGTHDVVDYIQYKGVFTHKRYMTDGMLTDTTKLKEYLMSNPIPE